MRKRPGIINTGEQGIGRGVWGIGVSVPHVPHTLFSLFWLFPHTNKRPYLLEPLFPDSLDLLQLIDRREGPMLGPIGDDPLCVRGADAGKLDELGGGGCVQIDALLFERWLAL